MYTNLYANLLTDVIFRLNDLCASQVCICVLIIYTFILNDVQKAVALEFESYVMLSIAKTSPLFISYITRIPVSCTRIHPIDHCMLKIWTPAKSHDQGLTLKYGQYTPVAFNDVHFDDRLLSSMRMPDEMNWICICDICICGSFMELVLRMQSLFCS